MTSQPKTTYLKDYRPADFIIESVHLNVDLHEDETCVKSILAMHRNPEVDSVDAPLVLNGEAMVLKSVSIDGKKLSPDEYKVDENSLTINHVPNQFKLETEVMIKPQENTTLSGLYKSRNNFCTQCESHGFRRITYYLDRPDVMSRFTTTITADKTQYPMLLSNGNLIEEKELDNNRHWVHWEDPSLKPSYLFALVAGDFDLLQDKFVTMSGREVDLRLYLEKGFKDQGAYALKALKHAMKWDEETYGREYDLDIYMIVAVSDFNMGAMENKGLNIFNTKYVLANSKTATDSDYVAILDVIGHEYFHNWSGNRVTCRDWFQITLKEGLTVFRDATFTEDLTSPGVARIDFVNYLRNTQFLEDAGPMAHPIRPRSYIEINNFYTNTVYRKGCEVIRMVRTLIGKDLFRKGMDLYFSRHDGQAVTTEDFIKAMEDASSKDLTQFKRWYDQAGTPVLDVSGEYDQQQKTFTLTVKQSCPPTPGQLEKEPFHLPLAVGLIGPDCQEMPTQLSDESNAHSGTRVLEIKKPVETFCFVNVEAKPVPSLLREFSAPVILNYPYTDDELLWLLNCDTDPFAKWEAGQKFEKRLILKLVSDYQAGRSLEMDDRLIKVFQHLLQGPHDDHRFSATLMALPSQNYLLQQMDVGDVEAVHKAREFVKMNLAKALEQEFVACYEEYQLPYYEYNPVDMGKRGLKNSCLSYLVYTGKEKYLKVAYQQLIECDNMTDAIAALSALINQDSKERNQSLNEFYEKWKDQPLVINKWLALQASSTLPSTLDEVKQLLKHPAFNIRNPNNVYALIGAFGMNVVRFHDAGGDGYQFVIDQVLAIDPANPQVAARMLQPLTQWRKMDKKRQALMKEQLGRIVATPKVSKDIYEIAVKSLAE